MSDNMITIPAEEYKRLLKKEAALDGIRWLMEQNTAQEFSMIDVADVKKLLLMLGVE